MIISRRSTRASPRLQPGRVRLAAPHRMSICPLAVLYSTYTLTSNHVRHCRPDRGSSGSNSHDRQVSGRPGDEKAFLRAQRPLDSLLGYGYPRQPGSEPWVVYGRVRADEKATETGLLAKTRNRYQHPRYVSTDQLILCPTENSCTEPTSRQPPLFPSCHIAYLLVLASCVSSGYL